MSLTFWGLTGGFLTPVTVIYYCAKEKYKISRKFKMQNFEKVIVDKNLFGVKF